MPLMGAAARYRLLIRSSLFIGPGLLACALLYALTRPHPQDWRYHQFTDARPLLGVPNALNVLSNVPFLLVGGSGLWFLLAGRGAEPGMAFRDPRERWPFVVMFLGVALTAFGSSYYHLAPDNDRLVWDRLPMALGFAGIIAAMVADRISPRAGLWLLGPLVLLCVGSVLHWQWTERQGPGDMRLYLFLQGYTLFVVLAVPLLFPPRYTRTPDWYVALFLYGLAKLCESGDATVYALGNVVSGHTLKHLLSALALYWLLRMLEKRRPLYYPPTAVAPNASGISGAQP